MWRGGAAGRRAASSRKRSLLAPFQVGSVSGNNWPEATSPLNKKLTQCWAPAHCMAWPQQYQAAEEYSSTPVCGDSSQASRVRPAGTDMTRMAVRGQACAPMSGSPSAPRMESTMQWINTSPDVAGAGGNIGELLYPKHCGQSESPALITQDRKIG